MRFIRGDSLKDAIEYFHRADRQRKRDPGDRSFELPKLLSRFSCRSLQPHVRERTKRSPMRQLERLIFATLVPSFGRAC